MYINFKYKDNNYSKLELHFWQYNLGTLEFDGSEYIYNSNPKQEQMAEDEKVLSAVYNLFDSVNLKSKTLFKEFLVFEESINTPEIVEWAEINNNDTLFNKLIKMAKLESYEKGFYLVPVK